MRYATAHANALANAYANAKEIQMCFGFATIIHVLIWAVAIGAALLIAVASVLTHAIKIAIWAAVIIFVVIIVGNCFA